jgi:hypothetical protein
MAKRCVQTGREVLAVAAAAALAAMALPSPSIAQTRVYHVEAQTMHRTGTVLKVSGVRVTPTHTEVTVHVINGHSKPIHLNTGRDAALRDGAGNRYRLFPPAGNEDLQVPPGEVMQGVLVFVGPIPAWAKRVLLLFNETAGGDEETTSTPLFAQTLELGAPAAEAEGQDKKKD